MYQQVDDLLDYCTAAGTGKPPLQDYRQRKWTWVLDLAGIDGFVPDEARVLDALFLPRDGGASAARRALEGSCRSGCRLVDGRGACRRETRGGGGPGRVGRAARVARRAQGRCARGRTRRPRRSCHAAPSGRPRRRWPARWDGPERGPSSSDRHARTFRFAARLFPAEQAAHRRGLYACCRFTDDLVDEADGRCRPGNRWARLDAWRRPTRAAFEGDVTGVPILDRGLGRAAGAGVSWRYPDAAPRRGLDLPAPYPDWEQLEPYTFGVAGAVGGWITQFLGFPDPELLECAHALGHAMQLTEHPPRRRRGPGAGLGSTCPSVSWRRPGWGPGPCGRSAGRAGPPGPDACPACPGDLMARADAWYARAWPGIRRLPPWYRDPVAVAAEAYRGPTGKGVAPGTTTCGWRFATGLCPTKVLRGAAGLFRARTGS